jgi:hypothetical protein
LPKSLSRLNLTAARCWSAKADVNRRNGPAGGRARLLGREAAPPELLHDEPPAWQADGPPGTTRLVPEHTGPSATGPAQDRLEAGRLARDDAPLAGRPSSPAACVARLPASYRLPPDGSDSPRTIAATDGARDPSPQGDPVRDAGIRASEQDWGAQ